MSFGTHNWDPAVLAAYRRWEPVSPPRDAEAVTIVRNFIAEFRAALSGNDGAPVAIPFPGFNIDLRGAVLDGAPWGDAWLNGAQLEGVRMRNAFLAGAQMQGSFLRDADLSGSQLNQAELDHADARELRLEQCNLAEMRAFETDFRGARFGGSHLTQAWFSSADLRGADFRGAKVDGRVSFRNSRLAGALLDNFTASAVSGPVFVDPSGDTAPLDGLELQLWFVENGASISIE